MSFFWKKKKYSTLALFDIGSHSVGGSHVLIPTDREDERVIVSSFARYETPYTHTEDISLSLKKAIDSIEKIAHTVVSSGIHTPETLYVLLRAPWVASETRTVSRSSESSFTCTKKFVEELLEAEIDTMVQKDGEHVIIEKQISSITLNGYTINHPYGHKTKELSVTFTVTIGSKVIIDFITASIRKSYVSTPIHFNSIASAVHTVSRRYLHPFENLFLIIAGEQLTEVGLVKNNIFYQYESFSPGIGVLYSMISEKKKISLGEAYSTLEAFRLSKLSEVEKQSIEKIIVEYKELWQSAFRETISKKEYGLCLPDTCCIVSREKFSALLASAIKNDPYLLHNCGNNTVTPHFLNESIIGSKLSFPEGVSFDIMTSIHALYVMSVIRYTL